MKRSYFNTEETAKFNAFDTLTENEMIQVRGGADSTPRSRSKDIFTGDDRE